jgi:hypothetical protein
MQKCVGTVNLFVSPPDSVHSLPVRVDACVLSTVSQKCVPVGLYWSRVSLHMLHCISGSAWHEIFLEILQFERSCICACFKKLHIFIVLMYNTMALVRGVVLVGIGVYMLATSVSAERVVTSFDAEWLFKLGPDAAYNT